MINSSKIFRSGCNPRTIFYSQSSKGHEYNYGSPILSITGKSSRHVSQISSGERKLFSNIKPHPLPNSKRTINPIYNDTQIKKFNKAKKYNWQNSSMDQTLIETKIKKNKPGIKIYSKKNKTSYELNNNKNENENNTSKNSYSFYIKNKYDYNSEILNLPGGTKRKNDDIKDDLEKNNIENNIRMNYMTGFLRKRDFNNSKISCLKPFKKNKNFDLRSNIINSNNNKTCFNEDYYTNNNSFNNKNIISNNSIIINNNNKYKYRKETEISKDNSEFGRPIKNSELQLNYYNDNLSQFYQPIKHNDLLDNYIQDSARNKNNDLMTHYSRKRNNKFHNRVFNEVHQENQKYEYNLMKYYGSNYSKRKYSQFELN